MLGWEFPPCISGGLGTACAGLTGAMARHGAKILFALPRVVGSEYDEAFLAPNPDPHAEGSR